MFLLLKTSLQAGSCHPSDARLNWIGGEMMTVSSVVVVLVLSPEQGCLFVGYVLVFLLTQFLGFLRVFPPHVSVQ